MLEEATRAVIKKAIGEWRFRPRAPQAEGYREGLSGLERPAAASILDDYKDAIVALLRDDPRRRRR